MSYTVCPINNYTDIGDLQRAIESGIPARVYGMDSGERIFTFFRSLDPNEEKWYAKCIIRGGEIVAAKEVENVE